MPSEITNLSQINFWYVLGGLAIILIAAKLFHGLISWLFEKLGLEFKWLREKKENIDLLNKTVERVDVLEEKIDIVDKYTDDADKRVEDSLNSLLAAVEQISGVVDQLDEHSKLAEQASREALGDRINQRFRYYIDIQGIPEDELDEFTQLYAAYKAIGGNHSGEAKYKYCIEKLPILPPHAHLVYDKTE